MADFRIGLVTSEQHRNTVPDDSLLIPALAELGYSADQPAWDNAATDWSAYDALVIRTTWDYQYRLPEFLEWLDKIEALGVPLWNPPAVLRWNCRKSYLRELAARGVRIPQTVWIEPGADADIRQLLLEHNLFEAVIKPVVGASGLLAHRISINNLNHLDQNALTELRSRGMMIQEFLPEILEEGEWSLVFLGGEFSHAVLKTPQSGDFRVQHHHGGTCVGVTPAPDLIEQAKHVLAAAPEPLFYARVDGVVRDKKLILIELELFEPWCYLTYAEGAVARFADKLIAQLQTSNK